EAESRMAFGGAAHHLLGEVDAHPHGRPQRGEEVAPAAAQLQHSPARRDQVLIDPFEPTMVGAAEAPPPVALAGHLVPVLDPLLAIALLGCRHFGPPDVTSLNCVLAAFPQAAPGSG